MFSDDVSQITRKYNLIGGGGLFDSLNKTIDVNKSTSRILFNISGWEIDYFCYTAVSSTNIKVRIFILVWQLA